jgi:hypothetical protein
VKVLALACLLVACTPRNEPKGPGTLPEPVEGTVATSEPARPAPASRPAVTAPVQAPTPTTAPPEDVPPPRAKIVLAPAKGSAIKGELAILQSDDDTHVSGTLTGLAKNTEYLLGKREQCATQKADDDSRRSKTLIYGVTFKTNAAGVATIDDTSTAIHLDGPLSLMGAIFVVSKGTAGKELACGRVVAL